MLPYITIFGKQIPLYGLLFITGVGIAALASLFLYKRNKVQGYDLAYSAVYAMIGAMTGAKLLFIIVSWKTIVEYGLYLEALLTGGFVFYGGLIGGILGLLIYCKQYKLSFGQFADIFATVIPLGHAFGRVGCFFGGCCYGMEYHGPLSYTYKYSMSQATPLGVPLLPVQLIESAILLLLFAALVLLYFRKTRRRWDQVIYYTAAYAVIRFTLEFFRGDAARGSLLILSTSQWISLLLLAGAVVLIILRSRKKPAEESDSQAAVVADSEDSAAEESAADSRAN